MGQHERSQGYSAMLCCAVLGCAACLPAACAPGPCPPDSRVECHQQRGEAVQQVLVPQRITPRRLPHHLQKGWTAEQGRAGRGHQPHARDVERSRAEQHGRRARYPAPTTAAGTHSRRAAADAAD